MSRKKLIITGAVLAVVVLIGGLLAYFTDTTEVTHNTFTVGEKVDITLTETWNPKNGEGLSAGKTVEKVPVINNVSTTTSAYVFIKVVVPKYFDKTANSGAGAWVEAFSYTTNSGWSEITSNLNAGTSTPAVHMYAYAENANSGTMTTLTNSTSTTALFNNVTFLPGKGNDFVFTPVASYSATPTGAEVLTPMDLDLTGYAIQTNGLTKTNDSTQDATTAQDIYACLAAELSLTL